jgi:DHA2 family methylenomycin A resistance protein-like MFS transporter
VDWPGALAFGAALVALTLLLNALGGATDAWLIVAATVVFVVAGTLFVQRQRGSELPVAEWRLFRNRSYAAATSYILLNNLVMYTTLLTVPFFVEEVQGRGNGSSGLLLGAMSVVIALTSPVGGRISDAVGRRGPALAGSLVVLGGVTAILLGLDQDVSFGYLALTLGVLGLGIGLSFGAAQTAAIEAAPRALAGSAAGTNAMMRYLGSIVGAGVLGAVLGSSVAAPDVAVFRLLFGVLVAMAALAAAATLLIHRFPAEAHGPERRAPTPGLTRAPTAQDRLDRPVPTQELR